MDLAEAERIAVVRAGAPFAWEWPVSVCGLTGNGIARGWRPIGPREEESHRLDHSASSSLDDALAPYPAVRFRIRCSFAIRASQPLGCALFPSRSGVRPGDSVAPFKKLINHKTACPLSEVKGASSPLAMQRPMAHRSRSHR
jgi:hypothetical protein